MCAMMVSFRKACFGLRRSVPLLLVGWLGASGLRAEDLYVDYSPKPRVQRLTRPTVCILDPHAEVDIATSHERGHRLLAYVSLVEVAQGSVVDGLAQRHGLVTLGTNEDWNSHLLDILSPAWADFIIDQCAAPALAKGYDGLFFDTLDSVERLAGADLPLLKRYQSALAKIIEQIARRWPGKPLVVNRGFALLPRLKSHLSGVLIESVYHSFDPATKRYRVLSEADSAWVEGRIRMVQNLGLKVYAVDYASPVERAEALRAVRRLRELGCIPFVTSHRLNGDIVAPEP